MKTAAALVAASLVLAPVAAVLPVAFAPTPAVAVQPDEVLPDPALEARARALSTQLRCMVCQNQSIDDSDAPLARDLRVLVRERLVAGDSDGEVIDFLVHRYGEFVLLAPRLGMQTLILWLAAPLVLIGGAILAWRVVRRPGRAALEAALTDDERREIDTLLKGRE